MISLCISFTHLGGISASIVVLFRVTFLIKQIDWLHYSKNKNICPAVSKYMTKKRHGMMRNGRMSIMNNYAFIYSLIFYFYDSSYYFPHVDKVFHTLSVIFWIHLGDSTVTKNKLQFGMLWNKPHIQWSEGLEI